VASAGSAVRSLARQILRLRRKANDPKAKIKVRNFARREQKELYERLRAIVAAEKEGYDPLIDDITLEEIGITGQAPLEAGTSDDDLALRLDNAEAGQRPRARQIKNWQRGAVAVKQIKTNPTITEVIMLELTETEAARLGITPPEAPAAGQQLLAAGEPTRSRGRKKDGEPRRPYNRKPKPLAVAAAPAAQAAAGASVTAPVNGNGGGETTVRLTPEQTSKLWQAITGGQIHITGEATIEVTLASFKAALPALLEKL
jgi:hypothetical protein